MLISTNFVVKASVASKAFPIPQKVGLLDGDKHDAFCLEQKKKEPQTNLHIFLHIIKEALAVCDAMKSGVEWERDSCQKSPLLGHLRSAHDNLSY